MIQNYDTNGLVFLLNFEKSSTNDEQMYKRAVLNILNAQKFSCIPLVDGPRIRSNTNNLTDRATYEEGGKVTHIARKGIYEGEEEIEIIPISEIKHVQGNCDLIEGLLLLFEEREDGICDFIITVGGTSEYPIAMFTLNELKNSSTKEHLFRRVAYYGADLGKAKGANFVDFAKAVYENLEEIITSKDKQDIKKKREGLSRGFKEIPQEIDNYNVRKTSLIQSTNFSNLCIKDVMQMVMCGIEKNDDDKVVRLARDILSKANDFSNLAVYEDGKLNLNQIYTKSRNDSIEAKSFGPSDSIRDLILSFDEDITNSKIFVIVEPDSNIVTGEGEWRYPGCITKQELFSPKAMLFYAASCVMIENVIRERLKPMLPMLKGKSYMTLEYKYREPKNLDWEEATLGHLVHYIKQEGLFNRIFPNANNRFTPDDLGQLNKTRIELVHFALVKCFGENPNLDHVHIRNIQSMIKIGESLNIY